MSQSKSRLSRRQFIQGGAAAFGIPMIIPGSALGLNGRKPPSERVTMGFIGVGYQARGHLETMKRRDDVQILAVCDVDTTRREDAKKRVDDWYEDKIKAGTYKACDAYVDFHQVTT